MLVFGIVIISSCFVVLLVAGFFYPFTIRSSVKNKQHFHSRQLASYLVYGSEGIVREKWGSVDIRNLSTHHGASGRDTVSNFRGRDVCGLECNNINNFIMLTH